MSLSLPNTPMDVLSSDLPDPTNAFRSSSFLNFDQGPPPVDIIPMTPPPSEHNSSEGSSAVHSDATLEDMDAQQQQHQQPSEDQGRKMPRIVSALAVPESKTKKGTKRKSSSSSSSSAAKELDPRLLCKGGCGRPPVPSVLCIHCQSVTCMACGAASTQCPAGLHHAHIRVDYISDFLRPILGSDSKQVDAWIMASVQDMIAWLEREKHVKVWFNPQWNGSVQERVEFLLRIHKITTMPESERLPANCLRIGNGSFAVLRTHSEPAYLEMPGAMLVVAVTFPGMGCFSLNQIAASSAVSSSSSSSSSN